MTKLKCLTWTIVLLAATTAVSQVTSTGGTGYVPYFTLSSNIGNSPIYYYATNGFLGIGTQTPAGMLDINGSLFLKGTNGLWTDYTNWNIAIGSTALPTTAQQNGQNNVGMNLIAIGRFALNANTTGGMNVAVGSSALRYNTSGNGNSALGIGALGLNTTGFSNGAFGNGALANNTSGGGNSAFGSEALYSLTTGSNNSAFGAGWGSTGVGRSVTTGSNNSLFGGAVGENYLATGSNDILIGTDASTDTPCLGPSGSLYSPTTPNPCSTSPGLGIQNPSSVGAQPGLSNFLDIGNTIYATNMRNLTNPNGVGYVGIGTWSPTQMLEVAGNVQVDGVLVGNPNLASEPSAVVIGTGGLYFTGQTGTQTQTTPWTGVLCGGDYAEVVDPEGDKKAYEPGDVLVISDDAGGDVRKSSTPYSTTVAGIYATKPRVVGRRESLPKDAADLPMAMVGIVPTKVIDENGPIHRGDLLVSSSRAGYAMKGTDRSRLVGAVLGKAMGSLETGTGVIEVLVTLQ